MRIVKSKTSIDLSIIILSYNTKQITLDCLGSILKHTKSISYEIIIVDNGSTDGSLVALKDFVGKHASITLVDAKKNLGFGRGNNLGVQKAKGEYLLFLNSDTLLTENTLARALENLRKLQGVGIYSCRLLNADGSFQASGGHFPTLGRLIGWQLFLDDLPLVGRWFKPIHPNEPGFFFLDRLFKPKRVKKIVHKPDTHPDWVTGAFMIIPKKIFDTAGGFDKNIFMYTEEMELSYRIAGLGYSTLYQDDLSIIHLGKASGGSYLALTEEIKNMIYFWKKHMPHWQLPLIKLSFWTGSLLRWLIFGIIKGDDKARRAYFDALGFIF